MNQQDALKYLADMPDNDLARALTYFVESNIHNEFQCIVRLIASDESISSEAWLDATMGFLAGLAATIAQQKTSTAERVIAMKGLSAEFDKQCQKIAVGFLLGKV